MSDTGPSQDPLAPDADQMPVNTPVSGTYGEQAQVERLRDSLPSTGGPGSGSAGASPQGSAPPAGPPVDPSSAPGRQPPATGALPGVPEVLLQPGQPAVAPGGPMGVATPGAADPEQRYIAYLDALRNDPNMSAATKEWADIAFKRMTGT